MPAKVFFNGQIVPLEQAKISALDYGFLFGYSLFETMRAYAGKIFALERHLERLAHSAPFLGLPADKANWKTAVVAVLDANELKNARVRLVLSAGPGSLSPDLATCSQPTLLALAAPYVPPAPEVYRRGYRVIISSIRRNSQSPLPGIKSANFLESLLARQEARQAGNEDALLLNDKGYLAEASSSNVFVLREGKLLTPPLDSGILPGVTRELILELAPNLKLAATEGQISQGELLSAEEVFMTNSMIEIMPVSRVGSAVIGGGAAGPVSLSLLEAYRGLVQES
jgi:branched-chain amino acid aminotransferase